MSLAAHVRELLGRHAPVDDGEEAFRARMTALLGTPAPFARHQTTPGHFTASAYVLHPSDAKVLLIEHAVLKRWLQPGGHIEAEDRSVYAAARREVLEETGASLTEPLQVFDLDIHAIPANPRKAEGAHEHFDIRVVGRAVSPHVRESEETTGVAWVPLSTLARRLGEASGERVQSKLEEFIATR